MSTIGTQRARVTLRRSTSASAPWIALACASLLGVAVTWASTASAVDPTTEEAAKKADSEAMDIDFLSLDMKKAKTKLQGALKKCGKNKCSNATRAALHRDLGIVLLNSKDPKGGAKELDAALSADATIGIGKDLLDNPDVKKAWEAAKKKAGVSTPVPVPTATATGDGDGDGGDEVPAAEGNLVVKVRLAPTQTELPILVEAPKGSGVAKVKLSYKTAAMDKYKVVEAKKVKSKWFVLLDCTATAKAGTIKYFIKAYDDDNTEVEHYGTIKKPAVVKVVDEINDEDRPLLPGDEEPKSCEEGAEGGGEAGAEEGDKKPDGAGCKEDDECAKGLVCGENVETGKMQCKPGERPTSTANPNKLWIGADFQVDAVLLGSDRDLCKQQSWACSADGVDVGVPPDQGITVRPGDRTGGKTDGGTAIGTKRLFLSLDYFVANSLSLGARLGYIFGGNPTTVAKFVPFHAEVRAQYFFVSGSFRPLVLLAAGYGRTEAGVPDVVVTPNDPAQANDTVNGEPVVKGITAYKLGGPLFTAVGAGFWLVLGERVAVNVVPLKLTFALPTFVMAFTPEVGLKFGF